MKVFIYFGQLSKIKLDKQKSYFSSRPASSNCGHWSLATQALDVSFVVLTKSSAHTHPFEHVNVGHGSRFSSPQDGWHGFAHSDSTSFIAQVDLFWFSKNKSFPNNLTIIRNEILTTFIHRNTWIVFSFVRTTYISLSTLTTSYTRYRWTWNSIRLSTRRLTYYRLTTSNQIFICTTCNSTIYTKSFNIRKGKPIVCSLPV